MEALLQQIDNYKKEISQAQANTIAETEDFRVRFLGTKGIVKAIMGEMKNVPVEEKKKFGQILNEFKSFAEDKYNALKEQHTTTEVEGGEEDLFLPGEQIAVGTRHPMSIVRNKIISTFRRL